MFIHSYNLWSTKQSDSSNSYLHCLSTAFCGLHPGCKAITIEDTTSRGGGCCPRLQDISTKIQAGETISRDEGFFFA